jgi:hypothetical protein
MYESMSAKENKMFYLFIDPHLNRLRSLLACTLYKYCIVEYLVGLLNDLQFSLTHSENRLQCSLCAYVVHTSLLSNDHKT